MLSAEAKGWVLLKSAHGAERYFTVYLLTKANEFPLLKKQEYFHAKFSLMLETMFLVATIKALCHTTYTKPLPKPTEDRMLKHTEWLCLPDLLLKVLYIAQILPQWIKHTFSSVSCFDLCRLQSQVSNQDRGM